LKTFPAGRIRTGLPRPESSGDALSRLINIELGFGMEMLADITRPTSLATPSNQPDFKDGIYVAQTVHNNDTKPDQIFHVSFDGTSVKTFVSLLPEADPTGLDFAPLDGPFKPGLYVSSNNRDGGRPGDWGGTIQWIDSEQNIVDFTGISTPNGPGEPGELAFGTHGWMRDLLLVVNSVGSPADILNISFDAELEPLFSDGLFDQSNAGNAFRSLAIPPEDSPFGDWVYMGEFGRDCVCIQRWHPERGLKPFVSNLEGSPHGMAFTSGSLFGNNLYVAIDLGNEGKVLRIDSNGTISEFISGLQGFLYGNGKDVLQFDEEHELLYVSDYYGHRIYRIGEEEGPLEVTIHGDTTPEPDISQGNSWETEFTLQHVGECVASGVYVDFAWSDHLTASELVSETGWQEHLPHTIRLHLGTVASASRHAFVLMMEGQANQTGFVTATVHASNGEAIRENNLTWSGIAIKEPEPWLTAIMLPGDIPALILPSNLDLSKPINLQWSIDLQNWTTWESHTRENVTLIPETFRDKEASFYRVGP
jgi:hypothetical protein